MPISFITLASLLRIAGHMHNAENIFRLNVRVAFGTEDSTSVDFRIRANFGPMYD
jgi:hypothetical protein